MGFKNTLGMIGEIAGTAAGVGGLASTVMGLFGGGNEEKKQLEQQKELSKLQEESNRRLMNESYGLQKDMYDYTYDKNTPEEQVQRMKEAGLNPAMMYGGQGAGISGTTGGSGGASIGGGTASGAAEMEAVKNQKVMMGLQLSKLKSEIDVNESVAESNRANAAKAGADTKTTDQIRDMVVEAAKQGAIGQYIDNVQERHKIEGYDPDASITQYNNPVLGLGIKMNKSATFAREVEAQVANMIAQTAGIDANALLTNEKAKGYITELLNDTIQAKAMEDFAEASLSQAETAKLNELNNRIIANAQKLNSEYNTGETANWKNITETVSGAIGAVAGGVANVATRGIARGAKTVLKSNPVKGFGK